MAARPVRGAFGRLEPRAGKLARGVLRGGSGGNAASLPDQPTAPIGSRCIAAFWICWYLCSVWWFCKSGAAADACR